MRVLQVIHGYPMRYNAGSEVYTQTICHELAARGHEVHVFTREENPFAQDYAMRREVDPDEPRVQLHIVNHPRSRDRYRYVEIDQRFGALCDEILPDIVHIGHLNHLSTSIVQEAARRELPIVYTLHDYWLMCPRGQLMQMHTAPPEELWAACDGQQDARCASRCYARYLSGDPSQEAQDLAVWERWVGARMEHVRSQVELVDQFIAPSRYLAQRVQEALAIPSTKLVTLPYGFDLGRLGGRTRVPGEPFTFGYIGTHIPAKGVHLLIEAFGRVQGSSRLRIWGRDRGQNSAALRDLVKKLPESHQLRVEWLAEYKNQDIVPAVFNQVDAIVVPSIWVENSPLVIHEALQAGVPVITANAGGMAELVQHEQNGLLFKFRDPIDLAVQLQRLGDDPELAAALGARRYLGQANGEVPSIQQHVSALEARYAALVRRRDTAHVKVTPGPWRITFDTNPDDCNLHCVMCEEHSPHSDLQRQRRLQGRPPRRMNIEMIERVLRDSKGTGLREIIPSTMGEPLLYKDFERILGLCHEHGVKLNLTTNGTFPRLGARAWAERIVPVTSDIKISWNSATKSTHERIMISGDWDQALTNVRDFIAVRDQHARSGGDRCRVTFQLTFLQTNVQEIAAIVRLAAELGVDRVKGHHLWAHFDEIEALSMRRDHKSIAEWNEAVADAVRTAEIHRLPTGDKVLLENIFPLEPTATVDLAPGGPCPFLGQEAWVSAEGRFNPCCAPDASRRTLGELGDLNTQSIREIWGSDTYRTLSAAYRNRTLCLGCNMRRPVEG
ncbi:glycosyltransferase [Myxococcota bacterium]|nr:glycosyltransferase [Myxococcota bacterium]